MPRIPAIAAPVLAAGFLAGALATVAPAITATPAAAATAPAAQVQVMVSAAGANVRYHS
jgi:hypothetical protein